MVFNCLLKQEKTSLEKRKAESKVSCSLDWLQSPVTKYLFLQSSDNQLKLNQNNIVTIIAGH